MVRHLGAGLGTLTETLAALKDHTRSVERAFRSTEGRHLRREFAPVRDEDEARQLALYERLFRECGSAVPRNNASMMANARIEQMLDFFGTPMGLSLDDGGFTEGAKPYASPVYLEYL